MQRGGVPSAASAWEAHLILSVGRIGAVSAWEAQRGWNQYVDDETG